MKSKKPIHIILIASSVLTGFSFLLLTLISLFFDDFDVIIIILISTLIIGIASFITFYFVVQRFLDDKLKLLYRIIRKGKLSSREPLQISMKENILEQAAEETASWALDRQKEISKLKEQEAFRREFLGNLAHELKTPVFSIQGYILTLLEGGLEDENVNRKFLERASKATERITTILNDLDDITKMEVNRFELEVTKFDIVELALEVMDSLEIPSQEKNITLTLSNKYEPIFVKADRSRIAQVFTNLISNSINYGNRNGKTVIRFYPIDNVIMTEVSDDGPGIDDANLMRLFERFYRVEQSRNRNEGGSGLGLAIVKHIIETQHKQSINVRSTVGVGSTFSFTLEKST